MTYKKLILPALVLGMVVLAVPVVQAATTATTISSQVGSIICLLTTSGTVNVDVTPTSAGAQTIASDIVLTTTNDTSGYTLLLAETADSSSLTSGSDTIPAVSGTQASPVFQTANTWGYRVDGVSGFGNSPTSSISNGAISGTIGFAAVPATISPDTLKTTSQTASDDPTIVWYGVAANTTRPIGTYTNSVTYTAVAN